MSALAPIVINDGATTPVAHTFSPVGIDAAGVAKLADRSGGIAIGFPVVTMSVRMPTKVSRNYKVIGKIVRPTLEVTSPSTATGIQPAPTKAYDHLGTFEFVLPERGTEAERKDILAYMSNLIASVSIQNAVKTFETTY